MIHAREDYNRRIACTDGSIPEDEPVFLLRAQDITATATLEHWIKLNKELRPNCMTSVVLVERHLEKMKAWPVKKHADVPRHEKNDTDCAC